MATNMFKKYTEAKTREWPVAAGTVSGVVVLNDESGQVGVTLTARGDATGPISIPGVTGGTVPIGGAGNKPNAATVAVDGSWLLEVDGVVDGDTSAATGGGTANGTEVYRLIAAPNTISLTATDGTLIGVVDDGVIVGGIAPVKIGAVL